MYSDVHPDKLLDALEITSTPGIANPATDAATAVLAYDALGGRLARIVGGPNGGYAGIPHFYVVDSAAGLIDFLGERLEDFAAVEPAVWVDRETVMATPGATAAYASLSARISAYLAS